MMQRYFLALLTVLLCPWTLNPASADTGQKQSVDLVELYVTGVAIDPDQQMPIVILAAPDSRKAFPMFIGLSEAQAIAMAMEHIATPRPLTHMLLKNILTDLNIKVKQIVIHSVRQNTFQAAIFLQQDDHYYTIDARPSDAIALALSTKATIFAAPAVLEAANTFSIPTEVPPPPLAKQFGMHMQSLDTRLAKAFHLPSTDGVLIANVDTNSAAHRHGVQRGDVIIQVNGQPIKTLDDIQMRLTLGHAQLHRLSVTRNRKSITILLGLPAAE